MREKRPNFFIVGAPKAGTDALFYRLGEHPDVYMSPIKEPCYFSSEVRPHNFATEWQGKMRRQQELTKMYVQGDMMRRRFAGIVSEWDDYLRLFQRSANQRARGEGSVCYLWSQSAANEIAKRLPDSKILIVLMDPAERAFAQYRKSLSDRHVRHSFREHVEQCLQNTENKFGPFYPFLEFGQYRKQVERYMTLFPREQINISLYEDATKDCTRWFAQLLAFLEVDTTFAPHDWEFPSSPITREDRALLVEYYRDDILELEELIGRNLGAWLH